MNVIYSRAALKDVRKVRDASLKQKLKEVILEIKAAKSISHLRSVKKLAGHPNAYRIKIRNYRLGLYVESNNAMIARFMTRNDIYKVFPP